MEPFRNKSNDRHQKGWNPGNNGYEAQLIIPEGKQFLKQGEKGRDKSRIDIMEKMPQGKNKNYEEGFDASLHQANLEYLNSHPGLISKIRAQIKDSDLRWRLKSLRHRLLFVPENRREFAALYEDYCRDIIHYVLDKTEAENPFQEILNER